MNMYASVMDHANMDDTTEQLVNAVVAILAILPCDWLNNQPHIRALIATNDCLHKVAKDVAGAVEAEFGRLHNEIGRLETKLGTMQKNLADALEAAQAQRAIAYTAADNVTVETPSDLPRIIAELGTDNITSFVKKIPEVIETLLKKAEFGRLVEDTPNWEELPLATQIKIVTKAFPGLMRCGIPMSLILAMLSPHIMASIKTSAYEATIEKTKNAERQLLESQKELQEQLDALRAAKEAPPTAPTKKDVDVLEALFHKCNNIKRVSARTTKGKPPKLLTLE
jgi:Skp family chaperone for outer membrane proteins